MPTISIESLVARWSQLPLAKGKLVHISPDGEVCRCAQGDILHLAGWDDEQLAEADQSEADAEVAKLLGISRAHAILLRHVNDGGGRPQDVLAAPEKILGPHARLILAFWHHLDTMTVEDCRDIAVWDATGDTAWIAACDAAENAAIAAVGPAASDAARGAAYIAARFSVAWPAARASNEIQGHEHLAEQGWPLVFLPMFGLTIDDLAAAA